MKSLHRLLYPQMLFCRLGKLHIEVEGAIGPSEGGGAILVAMFPDQMVLLPFSAVGGVARVAVCTLL